MPQDRFRSILTFITTTFLLAASVLITDTAHAQERTFSIRAGIVLSNLSGDADFDPLVNLAGALAYKQPLGPVFFQTEAFLNVRGAAADVSEPYPPVPGSAGRTYSRLRTDITYLDVPLFLGVNFGRRFQPFLYAGPYASIRLDAQNRFTYSDTGLNATRTANDVRLFDYGLAAGTGIEVDTRFYRMVFDLRAGAGMATIFDESDQERHRMLSFTTGIVF